MRRRDVLAGLPALSLLPLVPEAAVVVNAEEQSINLREIVFGSCTIEQQTMLVWQDTGGYYIYELVNGEWVNVS